MTEPQRPDDNQPRTFTDEMEIAAKDLVERVKELVAEGNVRRLIIRKPDGDILFEVPLTPTVIVGGAALVFQPLLAAVGAAAAFFTRVKLEVVRVDMSDMPDDAKPKNDDKERIELE